MSQTVAASEPVEDWKLVKLPDIALQFSDGPFGSNLKSAHYTAEGVRVIRLQNVGVGEMLHEDVAFISREHYESLPRNHCKPGDVIIGTLGEPNLRACVIPDDLPESLNKADCVLLRPDRSLADPAYICALLNSERIVKMASALIRGQTRSRISMGRLKSLAVPLPPLAEQKRIAVILDAADALRAKRRESLAQLDTLLQSTFLDMFGDPVTNPMRWEVLTGKDVFEDLTYGTSTKSVDAPCPGAVPVLRIPNVIGGQLRWSNLKFTNATERELVKLELLRDDLLFVRTNGNPDYIGRCARFDSAPSGTCLFDSYLIRGRIRPSVDIEAEYLKHHIEFPSYRHEVRREARTTAGNFNLSTSGIRKFQFTRPPLDLQHRFAFIVESVEQQKASQRAHLAELDTLFGSLQSRAFRGDL